jgi:hypothetical protein
MSRNGINSGLKPGMLQGLKSGMGFSRMESGLKKGLVGESGMRNKVQDPTLLQGNKQPSCFWIADFTTETGAGSAITGVTQLSPGKTSLLINSAPAYQPPYSGNGGVYNNRAYADFNSGADAIYTSTSTMGSGKNEFTLMMVVRLSSTLTRSLFYSLDSTSLATVGDIHVQSLGGNKIRVTFTGNPTSTLSVYETYDPLLEGLYHWHLLTVKCRIYQPNGQGSEMEIWLNGKKNMAPVTTTFVGSTSTFAGNQFVFGNNAVSSVNAGGSQIASAITFDYWLNPSEQMRIENFYRWYYGRRF